MKKAAIKATRTRLMKVSQVKPWQAKVSYSEIFVVPTPKKHDSGWTLMLIVGVLPNGTYEKAAWCDDICWNVRTSRDHSMRCDCTYPGGILHFWGATFTVGHSLSSTDVTVTDRVREPVINATTT